jgi:hypothetical protein
MFARNRAEGGLIVQQLDRIAETPRGWRQTVFDTVDDAYFAQGAMPPGSVAQLHRALDTMRAEHADDAIIDRAEAIAVTLHRLLAVLRETPGDAVALISIRRELRAMGVDWLKAMPVFH